MSNARTSAGVAIYIGAAAPSTYDKSGYEAVTWTKIGEVESISGDIGKVFDLVTLNLLEQRGVVKLKGGYNNGQFTAQYAYYRTDGGQEDLTAAVDVDTPLPFKISLTDANTTQLYMMGQVMGDPINIGSSGDVLRSMATIEIDSVSDVLRENAPA